MRPCLRRSYTMESNQPLSAQWVPAQSDEEGSRTRDYCVAKNATLRAARPDPSLRKERLFRMTIRRRLGGVRNARGAPACAWGRVCGPEADGCVPADRRGHTFLWRGKKPGFFYGHVPGASP